MFNFITEFAILRVIGKRMNSARLHSHWLINIERETTLLLKQWKLFSVSSYRIVSFIILFIPLSLFLIAGQFPGRVYWVRSHLSLAFVFALHVCVNIYFISLAPSKCKNNNAPILSLAPMEYISALLYDLIISSGRVRRG
jgi:hypothetical protein